jgi:hypothetical protein
MSARPSPVPSPTVVEHDNNQRRWIKHEHFVWRFVDARKLRGTLWWSTGVSSQGLNSQSSRRKITSNSHCDHDALARVSVAVPAVLLRITYLAEDSDSC